MKFRVGPLILLMGFFFLVSCNNQPVTPDSGNTNNQNEHEHSYSSEWKADIDCHWHECSCGEKKDKANHDWDDGKVVKEATDTEDGQKVYTCKTCGKEKIVSFNKQGTITNAGVLEDDGEDDWNSFHK